MHLLRAFNDRRRKRPTAPAPAPSVAASDDWDAPVKHDPAVYERYMAEAKEKRTAREAELAEVAERSKLKSPKRELKPPPERLSSYGDD